MQATVRNRLYRFLAPLWPLTIIGLVIGASIGMFVSSDVGRAATASTLIRIDPTVGPDQILTGGSSSSDVPQAYLADQLAYLSSDGYRREVSKALGLSSPVDLTATQEGQAMVVRITATADDPDRATGIVNAAVDVYRRVANDSTVQRLTAAMAAVDAVMATTRDDAIARVGGNVENVDQAALDARLETLRIQRVSLDVALRRGAGVDVIDPVWASEVEPSVSPLLGAVGGGFLGGLLALAAGLWWRSRSGVIASAGAVERAVGTVLGPVVTLSKKSGPLSARETAAARALYSQLAATGGGRIVVVGTSPSSGANSVGRLLVHAAAEHGDAAAVDATDSIGMGDLRARLQGSNLPEPAGDAVGTAIVVAPSFSTAPALVELLPFASQAVLVVHVGVDTTSEVQAALRSLAGLAVTTTGVATKAGFLDSGSSDISFERQSTLPSDAHANA